MYSPRTPLDRANLADAAFWDSQAGSVFLRLGGSSSGSCGIAGGVEEVIGVGDGGVGQA